MTITPALEAALTRLAAECAHPNWDGYDAEPVTPEAIDRARRFLALLPDDLPEPGVGAEPYGQVFFDWMPSPRRCFNAWLTRCGCVVWAWLAGPNQGSGFEPLTDQPPAKFISVLRAFLS